MRPLLPIALLLAVLAGCSQAPSPDAELTNQVRAVEYAFEPADVQLNFGSRLVVSNRGEQRHTATAADGSFDSGVLSPGESMAVDIAARGTIDFRCRFHPRMSGRVIVSGGSLQSG